MLECRWVVPLLWGPLVMAGLAACLADAAGHGGPPAVGSAAAHVGLGAVLWQLAEYCLHRWVRFHASRLFVRSSHHLCTAA